MNATIDIHVSPRLVELVEVLAADYAAATGADPPAFYREYYLSFEPHLAAIVPIAEAWQVAGGHRILEVGSGLGTRCLLGRAAWDAEFTGVEPCANTYRGLREAIREFQHSNPHLPYSHLDCAGEDLPLDSDRFDFAWSFEVMEHVRVPERVVQEMYRVLRPGGKVFISTCNYRSFFEGHYRTLWLPFLNRRTGAWWARLLGRNPENLDEINFLTRSRLLRAMKRAGFKSIRLSPHCGCPAQPALRVHAPPGFDPAFPGRRRSWWQGAIQRPRVQAVLSLLGCEYKLYVEAEK
jgi:SAM-dependent methyltransferase